MTDTNSRPAQTILCPVDFSEHAERALLHIAERYCRNSELLILHVGNAGGGDRGSLLKEHLRHFSRYSGLLSPFGCNLRFAVEYGVPAEAIVTYARTRDVDMIVMGSHGENNIHRLLVGSTTETVMRQAPCPVLVFKAPEAENAVHGASAAV
jgi:nucleotide-binding universal stress UspA family protein